MGQYAEWVERRREAELALELREEKLFASAKAIESQLELLGGGKHAMHLFNSSSLYVMLSFFAYSPLCGVCVCVSNRKLYNVA